MTSNRELPMAKSKHLICLTSLFFGSPTSAAWDAHLIYYYEQDDCEMFIFFYFLINLYSRSHEPLIKMEVGSPWPKKKEWKGQNESKGRNLFVTYDSITTISKLSRKMNLILHWYKYVSRMIKVGFMFFLGSNSCFIKLEDKPQRHPWV